MTTNCSIEGPTGRLPQETAKPEIDRIDLPKVFVAALIFRQSLIQELHPLVKQRWQDFHITSET